MPEPPAFLSDVAVKEWARLAPLLMSHGCLTEWDVACLALYCQAYADYQFVLNQFNNSPAEFGSMDWNRGSAAVNRAALLLCKMAGEFGLSPSARSKVQATGETKNESSKDRFFKVG